MSKVKVLSIFCLGVLVGLLITFLWNREKGKNTLLNPFDEIKQTKELPYKQYSFQELASREYKPGKIEMGTTIVSKGVTEEKYISSMFYYQSDGRRISGQINIPVTPSSNKMPVVVMARGYVDKEGYKTGTGTKNAAAYFANQGYITLAPDFSGYGESDPEMDNSLGSRLTKPVEVLDLLASLQSLPQIDLQHVYLWGHSNGGQIMLSVVELLGMGAKVGVAPKGVTLWAPVSKPFPYNILYYTDEVDDKGKWLRGEVAKFEQDYDVYNYSIDHYWDYINMPIQLHQGTADTEVQKKWSDDLVTTLKNKKKVVNYFVYVGVDHNMRPSWDTVVSRDLTFFKSLE